MQAKYAPHRRRRPGEGRGGRVVSSRRLGGSRLGGSPTGDRRPRGTVGAICRPGAGRQLAAARSAARSAPRTPSTCRRGSCRRGARARRWRRRCRAARTTAYGAPMRQALHEAAAEGVADAGRIDDPVRRHRRHVDARRPGVMHRAAVLAARDDQQRRPAASTSSSLMPGLLPDQLELVVVADHHERADRRRRASCAPSMRAHCWPGSQM